MAYTAIPDTDIDSESPITTGLMTLLRDNPIGIANGDAGAPPVQVSALSSYPFTSGDLASGAVTQPKLGSASVGQAQLKTSSGVVSRTAIGQDKYALPGGEYGFYPQTNTTRPSGADGNITGAYWLGGHYHTDHTVSATGVLLQIIPDWDAYITYLSISFTGRGYGDTSMNARQRYITASPPYDLGDGIVPAFVFAKLDTNGAIESLYIAPEPPWAHNGPTDIAPTFVTAAGAFKDVFVDAVAARASEDDEQRTAAVAAYIAACQRKMQGRREWSPSLADPVPVRIPVDQRLKNADMLLVPQPFAPEAGKTIVLLDPVSDLVERIAYLDQTGEDVVDIVAHWLTLDNTPLQRNAPAGVLPIAARFRQTRRA